MGAAAGMGASQATQIASMSIGIRPAVSPAAFKSAGNAAGAVGGQAAGASFIEGMQKALSVGVDVTNVATATAAAFTGGLQKALSGQNMNLQGVFNIGNDLFKPIEDSLGNVISKVPVLGGELKKVYETMGAVGQVSQQWLATISEIGNKWQEITRNIAGQTLNFGAVEGLTQSVQNLYAAGDILREADIPNSIGEIYSRLGMAGKELEQFALTYSQANLLLGTTLDLDNVTGVMNAFRVSTADASDTLTQLVNIARDTGADPTQLFNTLKQLGPSFQQLGYSVPQMGEIFAQFSKYNVPIDRLSFAFSGMIGQVEAAVQKGRFKDLSEGFNAILSSAQKLMDAGRDDSARNVLDKWFGDKGGGYIFDALRNNIMLTAEQMNELANAGVDPKYLQPLTDGIEKSRTFTESLGAMQRQLFSAFRPVGISFNEALGGMSSSLSDWLATHQADIVDWAFDVTEKAAEVFSSVVNGFANVLNLLRVPLDYISDIVGFVAEMTMKVVANANEIAVKLGITDNTGIGDSARELEAGAKAMRDFDLQGVLGEGVQGMKDFATELGKVPAELEKDRDKVRLPAELRDATQFYNTTDGKVESALGATADGKLEWLVALPQSQQAITEKLAELGVTITTVNGAITGIQANSVDQARALQKLFENLSSGRALQNPVTVDDKVIPPEAPSVPQRPLEGITEKSKGWGVAPSAYAPQMDAGDWLPQSARPVSWSVDPDGSVRIPAAVTVDKSRARVQEPADLMEAMGVPIDFKGIDGLSAPVGFLIEDNKRLLPFDAMDAMGIPTDFQGKDGVEAPTILKVEDADSKTPKEVMDGMGIPISWQGADGVVVPASYQATGGMGMPSVGATPGPGGGGFGSGPGQLLDEDGVKSSAASIAGFNAIIANFGSELRNYVGGGRTNDTVAGTHDAGLSIDIPIAPDQMESLGDKMLAWLVQNGKGLNMESAIWRDKGYRPDGDMNPDFNVRAGTHQDHIDVKFNNATPGPMAAALAAGNKFYTAANGDQIPVGMPPTKLTAGSNPLVPATGGGPGAGGDLQQWLYSRLIENGLSPDQAKGILAMNAVEGGATDPRSLLGFVEGQALPRLGPGAKATGPEGHLAGFMAQWNDLPMPGSGEKTAGRRGPGGSIPGVAADGTVTDWNAYMTWIREKIVGQLGYSSDWQGNAQPAPADYQRRLMQALSGVPDAWDASAWPNGNMPAGTGSAPRQVDASAFGGVASQSVESPMDPSWWDRYLNSTNLAAQGQKILDLFSRDNGGRPVEPNEGNWSKLSRALFGPGSVTQTNPLTGQVEETQIDSGMAPIFPGSAFFRTLLERAGVRVAAQGAAEAGAVATGTAATSGAAARAAARAGIPGVDELGSAVRVTVPGSRGVAGVVESAALPGLAVRAGDVYTDIAAAMRTSARGYGLPAAEASALRTQVVSALGNADITNASAKVLREVMTTVPARNAAGQFTSGAFDDMYVSVVDLIRRGSAETTAFANAAKQAGLIKDFTDDGIKKLLVPLVATLGVMGIGAIPSAPPPAVSDDMMPERSTPLRSSGGGATPDPGKPEPPKIVEDPKKQPESESESEPQGKKKPSIYPPGYYDYQGLPVPADPVLPPTAPTGPAAPAVPPAVPPPGTVLPPPAGPPPGSNPPPPAAGGPVVSGAPTGGPGTSGFMLDEQEKKYWTVEANGAIVWRGQNGNPTKPPAGQPGSAATTPPSSSPPSTNAAAPAAAPAAPAVPPPSEVLPPAAAPLGAEEERLPLLRSGPAAPGNSEPMPKSGTRPGYLPTPMQSGLPEEVLMQYMPAAPNYNPFTNPPPWAMTRQDWAQYGVDMQGYMGNLAQRDVDAQARTADLAQLNRTIQTELIPAFEKIAPEFETMLSDTGLTLSEVAAMDASERNAYITGSGKTMEEIFIAYNAAYNSLEQATQSLKTKTGTDAVKDAEDIAAQQKPPPRPPDEDKFSKVRPDGIAEGLGKGFVKGIMQEFGFDGSVFESPLNWAFTKFFTGTLNAGMGLLDWKSRQVRDPQQQLVYADGTAATGQGSPFGPGTSPVLGFLQGILGIGPSNFYQNNLNPDGTARTGSVPQISIGPSDPSSVAGQTVTTPPLAAEAGAAVAPAAYGGGMNININGGYTNMDGFINNAVPGLTAAQARNSSPAVAATSAPPSPAMQGI